MTTHTPAPAQQPELNDTIREVFLAHGFTIKEGQTDLKPYVYDAVHALLSKLRAPVADERKDYCPEKRKPGGCQLHNLHCGYPKCNEPPAPSKDVQQDTGNPEADRLIGRLMSSDPDFDDCAAAAQLIRALASAPVGGEAQHDTDSVCAWQVWWNQHKSRYTTTRQASLAAFAAGKEWRGAAPQASEAVRDDIDYSIKAGDVVEHSSWNLTPLHVVDLNWALRAVALRLGEKGGIVVWSIAGLKKSAQPGAQRTGGSDAE